jgi:putative ABC transport system substrate-binding protein
VRRIGFLAARAQPTTTRPDGMYSAFSEAMRALGYREGENLRVDWRYADDRTDRLAALATELASLNLELIVTHGTAAAIALHSATRTTPIVVAIMTDPVHNDLAETIGHPGKNVTGLTSVNEEISLKQVELLSQVAPRLHTVGLLVNPKNPAHRSVSTELTGAARAMSLRVVEGQASSADEFDAAFARLRQEKAQAVIMAADSFFAGQAVRIAKLATSARIASVSPYPDSASSGFVISYGPDNVEYFRLAANYVDKILKGAKPGDLPIEIPTQIRFVINRSAAKAVGFAIPADWALRADRVIE